MDEFVKASPLQLENSFFPEIRFEANQQFRGWENDNPIRPNCDISINLNLAKQVKNVWGVNLGIRMTWPGLDAPPFTHAFVRVFGVFTFLSPVEDDLRNKYLSISAPSILYTSAREFVKAVTSNSPFTPVLLPTVGFTGFGIEIPEEEPVVNRTEKSSQKRRTAKKES